MNDDSSFTAAAWEIVRYANHGGSDQCVVRPCFSSGRSVFSPAFDRCFATIHFQDQDHHWKFRRTLADGPVWIYRLFGIGDMDF
jgi:hypothetical protein